MSGLKWWEKKFLQKPQIFFWIVKISLNPIFFYFIRQGDEQLTRFPLFTNLLYIFVEIFIVLFLICKCSSK